MDEKEEEKRNKDNRMEDDKDENINDDNNEIETTMELLCGDIKNKTAEINKRLQEFSIHIGIITKTKLLEKDNFRICMWMWYENSVYENLRRDRKVGIGRGEGNDFSSKKFNLRTINRKGCRRPDIRFWNSRNKNEGKYRG